MKFEQMLISVCSFAGNKMLPLKNIKLSYDEKYRILIIGSI
jgi:hypothetical protein